MFALRAGAAEAEDVENDTEEVEDDPIDWGNVEIPPKPKSFNTLLLEKQEQERNDDE